MRRENLELLDRGTEFDYDGLQNRIGERLLRVANVSTNLITQDALEVEATIEDTQEYHISLDDQKKENNGNKSEFVKSRLESIESLIKAYKNHPTVLFNTARAKLSSSDSNLSLDSTTIYTQEIYQYKKLTREELDYLFILISRGVHKYQDSGIAKNEERDYIQAVTAFNLIYLSSRRIVLWHVLKKIPKSSPSFLDAMQVGDIGLLKAIKTYNPVLGSFSSYAILNIKHYTSRRYVEEDSLIRLPAQVKLELYKIKKAQEYLFQAGKDLQSKSEIAEHLKIPIKTVSDLLDYDYQVEYLETPLFGDLEKTNGSMMVDNSKGEHIFTENIENSERQIQVKDILQSANLRMIEQLVISMRYGVIIDDLKKSDILTKNGYISYQRIIEDYDLSAPISYKTIGTILGCSYHNIIYIERRCLMKIRNSMNVKYYLDFESS